MPTLTHQVDNRRTDEGGDTSHGLIQRQTLSPDDGGEDLWAVLETRAVGAHDEHSTSQSQRQTRGGAQSWREMRGIVKGDSVQVCCRLITDLPSVYLWFTFGFPFCHRLSIAHYFLVFFSSECYYCRSKNEELDSKGHFRLFDGITNERSDGALRIILSLD